jgi:hypothetical protein
LDKFLVRELYARDGLHLLELIELFPGDPADLMMRVHRLAALDVLELSEYHGHRHDLEPALRLSSLFPALVLSDVPAITVRPAQDPYSAVTARPPQPLPIAEMFLGAQRETEPARAQSHLPSQAASIPVAHTGTRRLCRERFKITLVDEDNESRAEELKEDGAGQAAGLKCVS